MELYNNIFKANIISSHQGKRCYNLITKLNKFTTIDKNKELYPNSLKILRNQEERHYDSFLKKTIKQNYYKVILYTLTETGNPHKIKEKDCFYDEKDNMFIATCRCANESKKNYLLKEYSKNKPKSYNERIESCNKN